MTFVTGADTTVSATASFFLLMALYPDVQARAQEEIDHVIRKDRLPKVTDRANLKYVDCVLREVMRLNPVAPLGEWPLGAPALLSPGIQLFRID